MYIPSYISNKIFKNVSQFTYDILDTRIKLTIEHDTKNPVLNLTYFKQFMKDILFILVNVSGNKRHVITILYKESNIKKKLPLKTECLTKDHINSGLCYVNSKDDDLNIVIFRRDEFFKVLIHELIHLYHIVPFSQYIDDQYNMLFEHININMNEAIVELNALLLNCIIISNHFEFNLSKLINDEYWWSLCQVKRLLYHFEISSFNELYTTHKWKETTHAFSYIVVKSLLLHEILYPTIDLQFNLDNIKITLSSKVLYFTKYKA